MDLIWSFGILLMSTMFLGRAVVAVTADEVESRYTENLTAGKAKAVGVFFALIGLLLLVGGIRGIIEFLF